MFLDNQVWNMLSLEQKIALFHGYYSADGRTKSHSISTVDDRLMQLIEDISALAGYYIVNKFTELRDTNYKKDSLLTTYSFIIKQNNIKLKCPEATLFMIIELASSTCFNSILYNIPLTIEEFKPILFEEIKKLLNPN